jgi:enamine deaminase RidA (YjgF/YER057c/UK114 family)
VSASRHRIIQPPGWAPPRGYSNGIEAMGKLIFVAGQIGWDPATGEVAEGFAAQTERALRNIAAVLAEAGAAPAHVVRMTWYITDREAYVGAAREIGAAYREIFERHYPAMSVVVVAGLLENGAMVEIEATAVV